METLTFVQGIFTVVGFLAIVGLFWAGYKIQLLEADVEILDRRLEEAETRTHFRMDRESESIYRSLEDLDRDIRSTIDSRFDKFLNQVDKQNKEVLKG